MEQNWNKCELNKSEVVVVEIEMRMKIMPITKMAFQFHHGKTSSNNDQFLFGSLLLSIFFPNNTVEWLIY